MKLPHIFSNPRFKLVALGAAFVAAVVTILNLFIIGGDLFIFSLNSTMGFPLALINAVAAVSIWRFMSAENHNRFLWSGMLIGWSLWALAEAIWAAYSLVGQEVPYPSMADFFWAVGYIPMGIGLFTRAQTMPTKPNRAQLLYILAVSAATILAILFFIIVPILQSFDPEALIESILSLLYPLCDLILLTIVWWLFFTYEEGDFAFGWRLLTIGFIFNAVADFFFVYADWNGLYYPDMQANFISRMGSDLLYDLSYIIWFLGIFALGILLREKRPVEQISRVRVVRTYGHILVYTKSDDTVLEISPNFGRFFQDVNVLGKRFADALTLSDQLGATLMDKLRKEGKLADLPVQIRNHSGALQELRLSAVAITNSQKGYLGANMLLRLRVTDNAFDDVLDTSSKAMVQYLLKQSGSTNKAEVAQFLADYYLAFIRALLNTANHEGGAATSQALLKKMQDTADKNNWQIQINPQTIVDHTDYPLDVLRVALPALLEISKTFVANLTDPASVDETLQSVRAQFSEVVRRDIERYTQPNSEMTFSDHRKPHLVG